jgi:hypothetical protein
MLNQQHNQKIVMHTNPWPKHDSRRQTNLIKQAVTIWPVCPYCRLPRYQPGNDVMA